MRVPVNLLRFGFWLFFLNSARCQECLREDIEYENTELAPKPSYADGETVKVTCVTGYIGSYKLKCEKGKWRKTVGRSCMKKKCNHPGDTPNGDFKLTEGAEFVFGASVVYTCNKGYEMTSRINQRTCRAQGWDNAVPVCEVVKCPAIHTDRDVTASGNTEEGSYGDVIQFECVSSDKKINGSSDIHCEETGEWSDAVPKCIDITCRAPVIPNGYVIESLPEYQKDAILKYRCDTKFKPREGIPRCTKFGWNLKPECDEVTCDLKSTYGIIKINPQGRNIFRAGESVKITCSEKHWIFFTKETDKTFTCKDNGEWDHKPVCEDIRCEVPHFQHVRSPDYYFRGDKKLGTKQYYYCESGYEKMAEEATCTRDGWTPNPLCEIMCAAPNIPNAEFVEVQRYRKYRINSILKYKCRPGFEPEEPVQITCNYHRQWTGIQHCTGMCAAPNIQNAKIVGDEKSNYKINSILEYKCHPGFEPEGPVQITCNSHKQWTGIQHCTGMCAAPNIPNSKIVGVERSNYKINSILEYKCRPGFEPEEPVQITCDSQRRWTAIQQCTAKQKLCPDLSVENGFKGNQSNEEEIFFSCNKGYKPFTRFWWDSVTCSEGSWSDEPQCIPEEECGALPRVLHGKLKQTNQTFRDGQTTAFECVPGFVSTPGIIKCTNGTWETPVCNVGVRCEIPPKVDNSYITSKPKEFYVDGSSVTYVCQSSFLMSGKKTVFCRNGTWEETPACEGEVHCEIPPKVDNAVITSKSEKLYVDGSNVTYICQSPIKMSGKNTVFCRNGTWEETPTCEAKCHKPQRNFMKLVNEKDVYDNKEILKYRCTEPYNEIPEGQWICENGTWSGNFVCTSQTCPPPPYIENGDYYKYYQNEEVATVVYYRCQIHYVLNKPRPYYKCENGKWDSPPKCLKPCEITSEILEAHNKESIPEKDYVSHGGTKLFYCKSGWTVDGRSESYIGCSDGTIKIETCQKNH